MADINVLQINGKDYISVQDTLRYLHCTANTLSVYVVQNRLVIEKIESARLIEWTSVQALAVERQAARR